METVVGIIVIVLGLFAWIGQALSLLVPSTAVSLGVLEREEDIDPTLRIIEGKAEGLVDLLLTWTLPASAILMLLDDPLWPYLAIFGAGVYLYFSGLIAFSRVFLKASGRKLGKAASVKATYIFAALWAMSSVAMLALAAQHLSS